MGFILVILFSCNNVSNKKSSSTIDENLKTQLTSYFNSLFNGENEKVTNYIYPALFEWADYEYADDDEYSREAFINYFIDEMQLVMRYAESKNYDFGVDLKNITKRISYNDQLIFLINTVLYMQKGSNRQEILTEIVCISDDSGQSWRFIEKDDDNDIDQILLLRFPLEIVNKIISN